MALVDRAGGLTFVVGGAHETSHHHSCTVFSAMMELRNEIQLGRLVMYILGSLPVERKNVIARATCTASVLDLRPLPRVRIPTRPSAVVPWPQQ